VLSRWAPARPICGRLAVAGVLLRVVDGRTDRLAVVTETGVFDLLLAYVRGGLRCIGNRVANPLALVAIASLAAAGVCPAHPLAAPVASTTGSVPSAVAAPAPAARFRVSEGHIE
jgi:hypothetical protein